MAQTILNKILPILSAQVSAKDILSETRFDDDAKDDAPVEKKAPENNNTTTTASLEEPSSNSVTVAALESNGNGVTVTAVVTNEVRLHIGIIIAWYTEHSNVPKEFFP